MIYCFFMAIKALENENIWEAKFLTASCLSSNLADPRKLHSADNTDTTIAPQTQG